MHLTLGAGASGPLLRIHASTLVVGQIARDAAVRRVIFSDLGEFDLDPAIAEIGKSYTGSLTVGTDLRRTPAQ